MISLGNSIRWRIFLYYTLLIGTALGVLLVVHVLAKKNDLEALTENHLRAEGVVFLPFIFPPADHVGPESLVQHRQRGVGKPMFRDALATLGARGGFLIAIDENNRTVFRTDNAPADPALTAQSAQLPQFTSLPERPELIVVIRTPADSRLLVGIPRSSIQHAVWREARIAGAWCLAIFAGSSLLGFWIITRGLSPVTRISETARQIASGDLSGRIEIRSQGSELGQLASVLNETFARLEDMLRRQVRFTADASHELRTPVAAIIADCQFSLKKPRDAERYRETIEVCHESAQYMRSLIERLGLLAKLDASDSALERTRIDVHDVAQHALGVVAPLSEERAIPITSEIASAPLDADPLRLGQVVINLLTNALRYNRTGGRVTLRTGTFGEQVFIEVEDTGIGISAEHLDRIFDRFYRVDSSRDTKTGGMGLGLAICRSIVEAHGGTLRVKSEPGSGSCFRIELPAAR